MIIPLLLACMFVIACLFAIVLIFFGSLLPLTNLEVRVILFSAGSFLLPALFFGYHLHREISLKERNAHPIAIGSLSLTFLTFSFLLSSVWFFTRDLKFTADPVPAAYVPTVTISVAIFMSLPSFPFLPPAGFSKDSTSPDLKEILREMQQIPIEAEGQVTQQRTRLEEF